MIVKTLKPNSGSRVVSVFLGLLLVFYLLNGIFYIRAQSITSDEGSFLNYALRLLRGHPERIYPTKDNSKMPVSVINLIPRAIDQYFHPGLKKTDSGASDIYAGRYVTLCVSLLVLILVFKWSKELYGEYAGLFSCFITALCPNLTASSGLVTTDSYSALALLATVYCLWKCCRTRSVKYFILFSFCVALSQLVKQSLFHLYMICPVVIFIYLFANRIPFHWKKALSYSLIFIFINWVVINLGFYFRDTNTALHDYHFLSNTFLEFRQMMPAWLPIPLPKAFITGLDMAKYYDQVGGGISAVSSFGKVTILGQASTGGSFWYYYFVSLFFKTPVSILIFITGSMLMIARHRSFKDFINNEFFLLVPVVYFLLYMSFLYNTQCGIRQIIFIYPLLYILCGSLVKYTRYFYGRIAIVALSMYLIVSVLYYFRNYYPYTNEFIADKKMAYNYVGASNLEFRQGNLFFTEYLNEHPDVKPVTQKPQAGTFLINVNDYLDIWNLHLYDWIKKIKPSGQVAFDGLLVTVSQQDIDLLNGRENERKANPSNSGEKSTGHLNNSAND